MEAERGTGRDAERHAVEGRSDGVSALAMAIHAPHGQRNTHVGVLSIARTGEFSRGDRELFEYLAGQAAISLENANLHETVQRQAVTDELTGLANVRELHAILDREVERARRFNTPLSLVMLDLDDFKEINDVHGHQQGDRVLMQVGLVLRELSREIDEPARYGGEELAVVALQTNSYGAAQLAERMREAIAGLRIPRLDGRGDLRVTASLGVASFPDTASDKGSLIAAADAALYRAKRAGKNRVERADAVTAPR
jgi:diguanylate cyclase (GGDEF)-like protein